MEVKGSLFQVGGLGGEVMVTKNSEVNILIMVRFPGQLQKLIQPIIQVDVSYHEVVKYSN